MSTTPSQTLIDFDDALKNVGADVQQAFYLSHEALKSAGIPHVVVGGLAINAYGHRYSTKDVDYLVEAKDAFDGDMVVTHRAGVPTRVGKVLIDYVLEDARFPDGVRRAMRDSVEAARAREDKTGVVRDWLLVWMKLNAGRSKDLAGIEGLVRAGLDTRSVREALVAVGPDRVVSLFDRCVQVAEGGE